MKIIAIVLLALCLASAGCLEPDRVVTVLDCADACPSPALSCAPPDLRQMSPSDAAEDASGTGQLFENIQVAGFTDLEEATKGTGLADLNRDGLPDILAVQKSNLVRVYQNQGCFSFSLQRERNVRVRAHVPNLVDFNDDGWLDIFISHNRGPEDNPNPGNSLLISQEDRYQWTNLAEQMGVLNPEAYNRGSSIGDLTGDGWLDIAVGADNIGDMHRLGKPYQRLYRFVPSGSRFEDGRFEDMGGSDLVPGFGGEVKCDADVDRAGPSILLRDLDNDGDLDLVQSYHADMTKAPWDSACASGEYWQGVYLWKNMLAETGEPGFEQVFDNGLVFAGKMLYDESLGYYVPDPEHPEAIGLPYLSAGDLNNDGLLDIIAAGPTDPEWQVDADWIAGRLWYNRGDLMFEEATSRAGLDSLQYTYIEFDSLFDADFEEYSNMLPAWCPDWTNQEPLCRDLHLGERQPYYGDIVFGDYDNDGWLDFLMVDRHEFFLFQLRNILYMNQGDGTFQPVPTEISGIDNNSMAAVADDLNGDGLLDLVLVASPGNSTGGAFQPTPERYMDTVYFNSGARGARANHWMRLRFSGVSHHRLAGARVTARDPDGRLVGTRVVFSNHSYKSSRGMEVHFGLGAHRQVDVRVDLPNRGGSHSFPGLRANRFWDLNLEQMLAQAVYAIPMEGE